MKPVRKLGYLTLLLLVGEAIGWFGYTGFMANYSVESQKPPLLYFSTAFAAIVGFVIVPAGVVSFGWGWLKRRYEDSPNRIKQKKRN